MKIFTDFNAIQDFQSYDNTEEFYFDGSGWADGYGNGSGEEPIQADSIQSNIPIRILNICIIPDTILKIDSTPARTTTLIFYIDDLTEIITDRKINLY